MYDKVKFHEVLYDLGIRGWGIKKAPETEEYFLANFKCRTGTGTNDMGNPCEIMSTNPDDFGVTWSEITTKLAELEAEYDAKAYSRMRARQYPITPEFIEAYTEKEIGGDAAKWDAYVVKYNKVRSDNPKP